MTIWHTETSSFSEHVNTDGCILYPLPQSQWNYHLLQWCDSVPVAVKSLFKNLAIPSDSPTFSLELLPSPSFPYFQWCWYPYSAHDLPRHERLPALRVMRKLWLLASCGKPCERAVRPTSAPLSTVGVLARTSKSLRSRRPSQWQTVDEASDGPRPHL